MRRKWMLIAAATMVIAAACGGDDDTTVTTAAPATTAAETTAAPEDGVDAIPVVLSEWAVDTDTVVPSGQVTFAVSNAADSEFNHEFVIICGIGFDDPGCTGDQFICQVTNTLHCTLLTFSRILTVDRW